MSREYYFFAEYEDRRTWRCLPESIRTGTRGTTAEPLFTIGYRSPSAALFFVSGCLLEFHQGIPPQPLSDEVRARVGVSSSWWIGYDELLVDHWDDSLVLATSRTEERYATCFADGRRSFPEEALVARGMDGCEARVLRDRRFQVLPTGASVDRRYEFRWGGEHELVDVTWTRSVAEVLGPDRVRSLRALRDRWQEQDLRLIVSWG